MASPGQDEQRLALFIDFENIAIGVRDAHYRKFDVNLVLERLLDKGKLLVKKAYADWSRYADYKRSFHEAAIELIEVPQKSVGGKNSADIRLVVDAMDMSFQKEHINCFVVASGDSDFSPLVSKLKENNKYVIGLGVKNSTSDLLIENCDEFIFYEDLVRGQHRPLPQMANVNEKLQECFSLLVDSILALQRENKEVLWGSMVKETMKRKKPSFNETYYGFRTFSNLLEDAQRRSLVTLRRDQRSGSYIIEDLGATTAAAAPAAGREPVAARGEGRAPEARPAEAAAAAGEAAESANGARQPRRRRGRSRRGRGATAPAGAEAGSAASDEALEIDEVEENDEDFGADEREEAPSAATDEPATDEPATDEPATDEPAADKPAAAGPDRAEDEPRGAEHAADAPSEAAHERSPFAFFSSLFRRETPAEPASEPLPRDHDPDRR